MGGLAVGLLFGLVVGLAVGLGGPTDEPKVFFPRWPRFRELPKLLKGGLVSGLDEALVFGLVFGLAAGLARGSTPKVGLTELILATTRSGRIRFMRLLADAHHRQVLRQAGAVYQFRHAELQDHLATIHRQHTQPEASA